MWYGMRCHLLVVCSAIEKHVMRDGIIGEFSIALRLFCIAASQQKSVVSAWVEDKMRYVNCFLMRFGYDNDLQENGF